MINKEEIENLTAVQSIALIIREAFPELNKRAFAISEVAITKENMPNLPLACVALLNIRGVNQSNNVKTPLDLEETICVEFWIASKTYMKDDGGISPFYAFQDYKPYMDRLFNALTGFFTPQKKAVKFISFDMTADEYCLTLCFKLSVEWRWCPEPDHFYHPVKISFRLDPQDVPKERGGSLYFPPNECGQSPPIPPIGAKE